MFYGGDLQSGISLAIQEQKLVACFVRQDDDPTSRVWEEEWLTAPAIGADGTASEGSVGSRLSEDAVFLRINAGTQEAGFLSAFCSLDSFPRLVIIRQGTVVDDLDGTLSQQDFGKRIFSHLRDRSAHPTVSNTSSTAASDVSQILSNVPFVGEQQVPLEEPTSSEPDANPAETPTASNVQNLLSERGARLEAERKQKEEAEKKARQAAARKQKETAEKQDAESSKVPYKKQDWLEQQRTRQQEARTDRERILKSIEADKAARKEREEQRRLAAQAESQAGAPESSASASQRPAQVETSKGRATPTCSLHIRLFDGSSIRARFDSNSTLSSSVRTYVDENSTSDIPYEFRQILTPHPSRTIEISEENESLMSLGLTPSATLVLVPVKGYQDAYAAGGAGGLLSKGINAGYAAGYGIVSGVLGAVGKVIGYGGDATAEGPYMGGTADAQEHSNTQGSKMADHSASAAGPSSGVKIRTLADQRREADKTELYNGNQLNFEPRKRDEDSDDTER
ncbi:hypothetical protein MBLNU459_g6632t1 [Dothideomycetes sp. NU459]